VVNGIKKRQVWAVVACLVLWLGSVLAGAGEDEWIPSADKLYPGKRLHAPEVVEQDYATEVLGRAWDFDQANDESAIAYRSPTAQSLSVQDGAVRFTAGAGKVRLALGHYREAGVGAGMVNLWGHGRLLVRVRQSGPGATRVSARFLRANGTETVPLSLTWRGDQDHQEVEGTDWHTLEWFVQERVRMSSDQLMREAVVLDFETAAGNRIAVDFVKLVRYVHEGWFRKTFELPDSQAVWRAIVNVGQGAKTLHVNGQEIPLPATRGASQYYSKPVDIRAYLRAGENVVGLYGKRVEAFETRNYDPFIYCDGRVWLASGVAIALNTDASWKASARAAPGWDEPGFDDSDWQPAQAAGRPSYLSGRLNAYTGPVVVEHPDARDLVFQDSAPVNIRVRLPQGFGARAGTLSWAVHEVMDKEGTLAQREAGEVADFERDDDAIVYTVSAGRLARGVYTIRAAWRSRDGRTWRRYPEPFLVVGPIPMQEVAGESYTEGLTTELEDRIDFTDPDDPHPWVESAISDSRFAADPVTEPRIVHSDGMVYRETGARRGDMYSYKFRFQHPGSFYLMELDYPDNATRGIAVCIQRPAEDIYSGSVSAPAVWTGERFPVSHEMRTLRWIQTGLDEQMTVDVVAQMDGARAAAKELRILRIEGSLPALRTRPSGERWIGLMAERGGLFGRNFGGWYFPNGDRERPVRWPIGNLKHMFDACERYVQYLRFTGQNYHMLAKMQYDEFNTPVHPRPDVPQARVNQDIRSVFMRVAEANDIRVLSSFTVSKFEALAAAHSAPSPAELAEGADTIYFVNREGQALPGFGRINWLHPAVREALFAFLEPVLAEYAAYPNWDGLNFMAYPGFSIPTWPTPDPLQMRELPCGYGDLTVDLFEQETGIDVPVDDEDPQRFAKRHAFLTEPDMRGEWTDWRNRKIAEFLAEVRDLVREYRQDAKVTQLNYVDMGHLEDYVRADLPFGQWLRETTIDPSLLRGREGLSVGRFVHATLRYWPMRQERGWAFGWTYNHAPEAIQAFARETDRISMVLHHFDEVMYRAPGASGRRRPTGGPEDWPWQGSLGPFYAQAPAAYARMPFLTGLLDDDPDTLIFGWCDSQVLTGGEQALRGFTRVYTSLPGAKFEPALDTDVRSNLVVRTAPKEAHTYLYVLNPGWWPVEGGVTLDGIHDAHVVDLATREPVELASVPGGVRVRVDLAPFGLAGFRIEDAGARVVEANGRPAAEAREHLRGIVENALRLADSPQAARAIPDTELAEQRNKLVQVQARLDEGEVAYAWQALTADWRLWEFWHDILPNAAGLRAYMVVGPFPNTRDAEAFAARGLVEENVLAGDVDFSRTYTGLAAGRKEGEVAWRSVRTAAREGVPNYLDLSKVFVPADWCLAYALVHVYAPSERDAVLSVGSDDGIRVWVNGTEVMNAYTRRKAEPGQDTAQVTLRRGWNRVLVKLENRVGGWGFFLEFLGSDEQPMPDLVYSTEEVHGGETYTYRMDGLTLAELDLRGKRLLHEPHNFTYFTFDQDGRYRSAHISRIEGVDVRVEGEQRVHTWRGRLPGMEAIEYGEQWTFGPRAVRVRTRCRVHEPVHEHTGGSYMPFYRFALRSEPFEPTAIEQVLPDGGTQALAVSAQMPERQRIWFTGHTAVSALVCKIAFGTLRVALAPTEAGAGVRPLAWVTIRRLDDGQQEWMLDCRLDYPGDHVVPAGYEAGFDIRLWFE